MKKLKIVSRCFLVSFFIVDLVFLQPVLHACPCGCGSASPLLLSHGEQFKFKQGLSKEFSHAWVDEDGSFGKSNKGSIYTLDTGFAFKLTNKLSTSLTLPLKYDGRYGKKEKGLGEPSVGLRYFLLDQYLGSEIRSEVYLLGSVKYPYSEALDSNGYWELSPGLEALFYFNEWNIGISERVVWRDSKVVNQNTRAPGLINRIKISAGYTWFGVGQVMLGLEQELRGQDKFDNEYQECTERTEHKIHLTLNGRVGERKTISLTYSQLAPFLPNKNTSSYNTIGINYIHSV